MPVDRIPTLDGIPIVAELRPKLGTIVPKDDEWTQHQLLELCKCEIDNDAILKRWQLATSGQDSCPI